MGIVNVTPDSFSDGGLFDSFEQALQHATQLIEQGADWLDVGGESTRPGSMPVDVQEELRRVIPVVEALVEMKQPVSVDTSKPEVMRAAIRAGATMINDVNALRAPGALEAVAAGGVAACLMHMQGEPRSMQLNPEYHDVVSQVREFLSQRSLPLSSLLLLPSFIRKPNHYLRRKRFGCSTRQCEIASFGKPSRCRDTSPR